MRHQFGAQLNDRGVTFKVWSPATQAASVVIYEGHSQRRMPMQLLDDAVFEAKISGMKAGALYKFALDDRGEYPDPYSRFQPQGPHGPSMVANVEEYQWRDSAWRGVKLMGQVIYELHIGAFTPEGTFDSAAEKLAHLRDVGVTLIEVMPVAEFPGRWNWGYDGVDLFAPYHGYGDYDAFKRFVDKAHSLGLGVMLDVVYNHVGPDGNYLPHFSPYYLSKRHKNDWGEPFNVDGDNARFVRQFIIDNACHWIREFHLDGLRLDATSNIPDSSPIHILQEMVESARAAAGDREIVITAEDEQQHGSRLRDPSRKGFGIDAMWNDDYHHSAYVALTGRRHAYFYDHRGTAQELISSVKRGFLFQGQFYHWQTQPRGEPVRTWAPSCVTFLDNHDQVANSLRGARVRQLSSAARYRALYALTLLAPQTPLLFMGQEFDASTPFLFFADHNSELRKAVRAGRREFLLQFESIASREALEVLQDPADEASFQRSKLNWEEATTNVAALTFTKELLALRKSDPVIAAQDATMIDGAVLNDNALVLRWFSAEHGDRLLLINLDTDVWLDPGPEPLLAPSMNCYWSLLWSSERVRYGGLGAEHPETDHGWYAPGESAILLRESAQSEAR